MSTPGGVVDAGTLLRVLRDGAPRTRAELARDVDVSRSTIAVWIDQLQQAGLVEPIGDAASTGGRPSAQFAFSPRAKTILAADFGASHGRVALTDLAGNVLAERRLDVRIADGPDAVLGRFEQTAHELLAAEASRTPLAAIGLGVPGPVEFATGQPVHPPIMPGWDRYDIRGRLEREFGVPAVIDNDVNVMALGERTLSWPGVDDLLFLKVATGIGAGVISGGALQRGAFGAAGDIGHAPLAKHPDVVCACGNVGCLEAVASGSAIVAALRAAGLDIATIADAVAAAKAGNVTAIRAVRQAGREIGDVLTLCVSLLNPAVIVVGGSLADVAEQLVAGIREVVYGRSIPLSTEHLTIATSRASQNSAIVGASRLAADVALDPTNVNRMLATTV